MAGGSTDAAAVLRGLNKLTGAKLSSAELHELAAEIGSDVAFCIAGGTQLASGRGEVMSPLPPLPDCSIVICKPDFRYPRRSFSASSIPSSCAATPTLPVYAQRLKRAISAASCAGCTMSLRMYPTAGVPPLPG